MTCHIARRMNTMCEVLLVLHIVQGLEDFFLAARVVGCPSWPDGDLERATAVHLVERGLVVLELEDVRDLG